MPVLKPTRAVMTELLTAINAAEKEILLQIFYVDNDTITQTFLDTLIQKSLVGVKVYLLVDALGAMGLGTNSVLQKLKSSGVKIEYFNWLTPWKGKSKKWWYFRNHKRALIIDNRTAHFGGWCLGNKASDWIECHVENADMDVIRDATQDFWNMFKYAHKTQIQFSHQKKFVYSPKRFSYTYQAPLIRSRYIYYSYKRLIQNSSHKIVFVTPYFTPIHGLLKQLKKARNRGVEVEIFLPRKTDHPLVDRVADTYMHSLLKRGVKIFRIDEMLHAKVSRFDNTLYVGTMNLDTISLRYNFENGLYIRDEDVLNDFRKDIEILKAKSSQLTFADWERRSMWAQFVDKLMKLLRPFV